MDYYIWAAVSGKQSFVIDTGFTAETAALRKRVFLCDPVKALRLVGIDPETVGNVILTHLHYDHVGNFHRFPNACFHLQDRELSFATGRYMRHRFCSHAYEVDDVVGIVRLNYADRVEFHDGDAEIAPGLSVHLTGGHAAGLQYVRVNTRRGFVIVASDVAHYYEHITSDRPFTTTLHIGDTLEGYRTILRHAPTRDHIIPGHDPLVIQRYPPLRPELQGVVARLDVEPIVEGAWE
jgi:glyoxylase-like metal-dependent hydrolase (beta-lactamase superfamily II)